MDSLYPLFRNPSRCPLGHQKIFKRVLRDLTKPTPENLQVVGPKMFGKTVLLHRLGQTILSLDSRCTGFAYWDLKTATPRSDDEFRRMLATHVMSALGSHHDFSSLLSGTDDLQVALSIGFSELAKNDLHFLLVLDGFDFLLSRGGITKHLLDELRSNSQESSLVLVSGTRLPLSEVAMTENAHDSTLWQAFNATPSVLKAFQSEDWEAFLHPIAESGVVTDASGKQELEQWSGGIPVLAALILHKIGEMLDPSPPTIDKAIVDGAAEAALADNEIILQELWDDLSPQARRVLASLLRHELRSDEIADSVRKELSDRGFLSPADCDPKIACRLMERYIASRSGEIEDLHRLFGDEEHFQSNVIEMLELRLSQLGEFDPELKDAVNNAIRSLPNESTVLLYMRTVVLRALSLVWSKELGSDQMFPPIWIAEWRAAGERWSHDGRIPPELGEQIRHLNMITGNRNVRRRLARHLTKTSALLIEHLHFVGNYGQHLHETPQPLQRAAVFAYCFSAVELCHSLWADFRGDQ